MPRPAQAACPDICGTSAYGMPEDRTSRHPRRGLSRPSSVCPQTIMNFPDLTPFAAQAGYSPQMIQWGFDHMLAHWTRHEFELFFAQECPGVSKDCIDEQLRNTTTFERRCALFSGMQRSSMLLITASTVPSAAFQDVFLSLLLPIRVTHRPSHTQYEMFQALHAWMRDAYPEQAGRWMLEKPERDDKRMARLIAEHDILNVSGSDETIRHFKALASQAARPPLVIAHGHRLSVAALFRDDIPELGAADFDALALDASVWDQTGCLSPKCIFFEGSRQQAEDFAQKLLESLDEIALSLPEHAPDALQLAAHNSACLMAKFDGARIFKAHRNHDTIVLHCGTGTFRPILLPRTLNLCPVDDAVDAATRFVPVGQAFATRTTLAADIERRLRECSGFNYFPRFGAMQDPPLTWLHDGIGTIKPLLPKEMI